MASRDWEFWMWQQAQDLLQRAERIRKNVMEVGVAVYRHQEASIQPRWGPPVNVIEGQDTLWVAAALPGVESHQVEVHLQKDVLILAGRRTLPEHCIAGELLVMEIPVGRFERRLRLPNDHRYTLGEMKRFEGLLLIELKKLL